MKPNLETQKEDVSSAIISQKAINFSTIKILNQEVIDT